MCCNVLLCVGMYCWNMSDYVGVCSSVLESVGVCSSVLQRVFCAAASALSTRALFCVSVCACVRVCVRVCVRARMCV